MIEERDLNVNPYSPEEARVARWLAKRTGIGGGNDPIGWLLASYDYAIVERNEARSTALTERSKGWAEGHDAGLEMAVKVVETRCPTARAIDRAKTIEALRSLKGRSASDTQAPSGDAPGSACKRP